MAFFRNLGVNLRNFLVQRTSKYASAESLDFLDLAEKFSFLKRKQMVLMDMSN